MKKYFAALSALLLAAASTAAPPATQISPDVQDFPSRGFRLEKLHLTGWLPAIATTGKTVLRVVGAGSTKDRLTAMVTIEASKPADPRETLQQFAVSLAKNWGSSAPPTPLKLDGEDALHIDAPASGPDLRPVEAVVAFHNQLAYLIMGGITPGKDCHPAIQEITNAWKWETLTDPSAHLDLLPAPQTFLPGLSLNYPRDMFQHPTDSPDHILDLNLFNPRTNDADFTAYIQLLPNPAGAAFPDLRDNFLANNNNSKAYDTPLAWTPRNNDPNRLVTDFSRNSQVSKTIVGGNAYALWALYKLDDSHIVLINFLSTSPDPKIRAKYQIAAYAIVDSLHPVPK